MREKYRIIKKLAQSDRNQVFLVQDASIGKYWVMKVSARINHPVNESRQENGGNEVRILKGINHRGIAAIVDYWEEEDSSSLVMEYVEGISLQRLIHKSGRIEERQTLGWAMELADILCYLHRLKEPVYYMDMKPDNIIVCPDGHIKLIDFDAAVCGKGDCRPKQAGRFCRRGTYGYAAPEQYRIQERLPDERTDIYGLGMTLYAMATGLNPAAPPYGIRQETVWSHMVSKQLLEVLRRCTQEEPEERYPSAQALLRVLRMQQDKEKEHKKTHKFGKRKSYPVIQQKSLFLSDQKYIGLFMAGLLFGGILCSGMTGNAVSEKEHTKPLLVAIHSKEGQKFLLQEGASYELEGALKLEIPEDYLFEKNNIIVCVQESTGLEKKVRKLHVVKTD